MSNNTAFGTAQPPKRTAAANAPSTSAAEELSSAPVDPEWEAARCALVTSYSKMLTLEERIALPLDDVSMAQWAADIRKHTTLQQAGCKNKV